MRNVVDNLITLLGGRRSPIAINAFHTELILRTVASGVGANGSPEDISKFASVEDAIDWLIGLRDRLGACLPWPATPDDAGQAERVWLAGAAVSGAGRAPVPGVGVPRGLCRAEQVTLLGVQAVTGCRGVEVRVGGPVAGELLADVGRQQDLVT